MSNTRKRTAGSLGGEEMKNVNWAIGTAILTFLVVVILLLSIGKDWLNFDSLLVFLAGLIDVAIPVCYLPLGRSISVPTKMTIKYIGVSIPHSYRCFCL